MKPADEIYSIYAKAYDAILPKTRCYQELVQETVSALEGKKTILDAGVGTGLVTMSLNHPGRTVYGIDINESMLAKAAEKVKQNQAGSRVFLSLQDINDLSFPDAFFDGVACLNVLYHTYDYRTPLKELARVSKNGAVLVLSGPNLRFHRENFLTHVLEEFAEKEDPRQYCPDLGIVVESTLKLAKTRIKHCISAEKMAAVLQEIGFHQIITAHDDAYYGNSYFVAAEK